MRSTKGFAPNLQEPYIRSRDNPFFDGLLRADDQAPIDIQGRAQSRDIFRPVSDIGDSGIQKLISDIPGEVMDLSLENSAASGFTFYSLERPSSDRWLKTSEVAPFLQPVIESELIDLGDPKDLENDCSSRTFVAEEEYHTLESSAKPIFEKTYIITKRKENLLSIPLPLSAAAFYNGFSPQMEVVELCESISKLNAYLRARRDDVNAGVPGRFLHAVMSLDAADVGSVASTIMYAFYLNETLKSDQYCTIPVINIKRINLGSHAALKWLLDSCRIDQSSLVFADEIDLSYYDLHGSLKIVRLDGTGFASKQEQQELKDAVVEIFNCRKYADSFLMPEETTYPWVKTITTTEDCSCCTAIAEKFSLHSPEILASKGFSKLLLAGILLDTENLTDPSCTSTDKYMASLLINGAGRYGCNGLHQLLKYKMHDVSTLQVADILRKDFKKWTAEGLRLEAHIGMGCIGISIGQLLAQTKDLAQQIKHLQYSEKLWAVIVVSGYYDAKMNFKREILVCSESVKLLTNLLFFFDLNSSQLPLKPINQPGLSCLMKAFQIDKITSRKTIERLLEEFIGIPKA